MKVKDNLLSVAELFSAEQDSVVFTQQFKTELTSEMGDDNFSWIFDHNHIVTDGGWLMLNRPDVYDELYKRSGANTDNSLETILEQANLTPPNQSAVKFIRALKERVQITNLDIAFRIKQWLRDNKDFVK
jgi:hypothetical protein